MQRIFHAAVLMVMLAACQTHDPDMASGQSSEIKEAYNTYKTLYQQGRYSEAEPYAKEALKLGTEELGPNDPTTADLRHDQPLGDHAAQGLGEHVPH